MIAGQDIEFIKLFDSILTFLDLQINLFVKLFGTEIEFASDDSIFPFIIIIVVFQIKQLT